MTSKINQYIIPVQQSVANFEIPKVVSSYVQGRITYG